MPGWFNLPSQPLTHTNGQSALLRASLRAALTVCTSNISSVAIRSWIVRSPIDTKACHAIIGPAPYLVRQDRTESSPSDILVENVFVYLTQGTYPESASANEKRVIRKKAKTFSVENGELFYLNRKKKGGKVTLSKIFFLL